MCKFKLDCPVIPINQVLLASLKYLTTSEHLFSRYKAENGTVHCVQYREGRPKVRLRS
jgi:hypothetical protein